MAQMTGRQLYAQTLYGNILGIINEEISGFLSYFSPSTIEDLNKAGKLILMCMNNPSEEEYVIRGLEEIHHIYARDFLYLLIKKDLEDYDIKGVSIEIEHVEGFLFEVKISKEGFSYSTEEPLANSYSILQSSNFFMNKIRGIEEMLDESL